jgi:hypothetical protein
MTETIRFEGISLPVSHDGYRYQQGTLHSSLA